MRRAPGNWEHPGDIWLVGWDSLRTPRDPLIGRLSLTKNTQRSSDWSAECAAAGLDALRTTWPLNSTQLLHTGGGRCHYDPSDQITTMTTPSSVSECLQEWEVMEKDYQQVQVKDFKGLYNMCYITKQWTCVTPSGSSHVPWGVTDVMCWTISFSSMPSLSGLVSSVFTLMRNQHVHLITSLLTMKTHNIISHMWKQCLYTFHKSPLFTERSHKLRSQCLVGYVFWVHVLILI